MATLSGHGKAVSYVSWLNSSTVITGSTDNCLKLWPLNQGLGTLSASRTFAGEPLLPQHVQAPNAVESVLLLPYTRAANSNRHGWYHLHLVSGNRRRSCPADMRYLTFCLSYHMSGVLLPPDQLGPSRSMSFAACWHSQPLISASCAGHLNERNFVGLSVTPDGYMACGSEDNAVYLYHSSLPCPSLARASPRLCPASPGLPSKRPATPLPAVCAGAMPATI